MLLMQLTNSNINIFSLGDFNEDFWKKKRRQNAFEEILKGLFIIAPGC